MIIHENTDGLDPLGYDIVICGGGIAGITFALSVAKSHKKILIIESGGIDKKNRRDVKYLFQNTGRQYENIDRQIRKTFGGSSHLWGGNCIDFQEADFTNLPHREDFVWPFDYKEYCKFSNKARNLLNLCAKESLALPEYLKTVDANVDYWQYCEYPFHFDKQLLHLLQKFTNIELLLDHEIIDFLIEGNTSASQVTIRQPGKNEFSHIMAGKTILAMGTLEITRFLLKVKKSGIIPNLDPHDVIGRYFTEHPNLTIGEFKCSDREKLLPFLDDNESEAHVKLGIIPNLRFLQSEKSLNFIISYWPKLKSRSLINNLKDYFLFKRKYGGSLRKLFWLLANVGEYKQDLYLIIKNILLGSKTQPQYEECTYEVRVMMESHLFIDSSVKEHHTYGSNENFICNLNWQLHEQDNHTFKAALKLAREYTREKLDSELKFYFEPRETSLNSLPSNDNGHYGHHMSTVKIDCAKSPGAVTAELKLIGTDNVYVISPAVFPAVSFANPTLMNMALAIFLAEKFIKEEKVD